MSEIFSGADAERLAELVDVVWGRDDPMPLDEFDGRAAGSARRRHRRLALRPRSGPGRRASGRSSPSGAGGRRRSTTPMLRATGHPGALGCAGVRGGRRGDGARARARVQPGSRGRGSSDARRRRALPEQRRHARHLSPVPASASASSASGTSVGSSAGCSSPSRCELHAYDPWLTDAYSARRGRRAHRSRRAPRDLARSCSCSRRRRARTDALLSRELLELVPADAVLVLVSRAHVVDFDALTELVLAGRFRAAIDVYPSEPLAAEHPIRGARAPCSRRIGPGSTKEALREIGTPRRGRPRRDRQGAAAAPAAGRRAGAREPVRQDDHPHDSANGRSPDLTACFGRPPR